MKPVIRPDRTPVINRRTLSTEKSEFQVGITSNIKQKSPEVSLSMESDKDDVTNDS